MQRSIDDQRQERLHGLVLLQQLNETQYQSNFQSLFDNIPIYDGNDPDAFFPWLDALEAACFYSGRDARIVALGKSTGRVRYSVLSVPHDKPWSVMRQRLLMEYSRFTTPAHAARRCKEKMNLSNCMCTATASATRWEVAWTHGRMLILRDGCLSCRVSRIGQLLIRSSGVRLCQGT